MSTQPCRFPSPSFVVVPEGRPLLTFGTTVSLAAVSCGTEMTVVQEGIPAIIPAEQCYLGWQQSLMLLSQLVEAEVNQ